MSEDVITCHLWFCPPNLKSWLRLWFYRNRDGNRSGRPAGRVAGRVEILRPAGQAGLKTGQILFSSN